MAMLAPDRLKQGRGIVHEDEAVGLEAVKTQEGYLSAKGSQATPIGYLCYLSYRVRILSMNVPISSKPIRA